MDAVHVIGEAKNKGSLVACASPVCSVEFLPTCLPWNDQRYCSDACRQKVSILRRAARLLKGYTPADCYEIMMELRDHD